LRQINLIVFYSKFIINLNIYSIASVLCICKNNNFISLII